MRASLFVLAVLGIALVCATTSKQNALITSLPGLSTLPSFDMYAGYITLQGTTKNIFYWFVEAKTNPQGAPVLLWMQGGPGCSGLGDGFLLEHGPFQPNVTNYATQQVGLLDRFYSWNSEANIIYIEQPCGVGFSYGATDSDYKTDDNQTAIDNNLFLQGFFNVYSEYAQNEFWITGESYGGVYITTLANQILTNATAASIAANLKRGGLMLGNPVTNCEIDNPSYAGKGKVLDLDTQVGMYYWHGMVSRRNYDTWNSEGCNTADPPSVLACEQLYVTITRGIGKLDQPLQSMESHERRVGGPRADDDNINPDMLYYSYCTGNGTLDFNTDINPGCFSLPDQASAYLNNPAVQSAIHAQPTHWKECGGVDYDKTQGSVIPLLENFFAIAPNMRILYYAGDVDIATVPFAETQRCLETMSRPITQKWRPWTINLEVAGYVEVYDTYTFATMKGAGHEAPQFQSAAGYTLFTSFLNNVTFPE